MILKKFWQKAFFLFLGLAQIAPVQAQDQPQHQQQQKQNIAEEEQSDCPRFGMPYINVVQRSGRMMQNRSKTAFDIAREKSVTYNGKMPMRQGNIGRAIFEVWTNVDMVPYPHTGCIVLEKLDVNIKVGHEIEIAKEYPVGSCMYEEFYILENELMRQDEVVINNELEKLREELKATFRDKNAFRSPPGVNIDKASLKKEQEFKQLMKARIDNIAEKVADVRKQSDLPEFFAEIEADCAGE